MTHRMKRRRAASVGHCLAFTVSLVTAGLLLAVAGCAPPRGRPPAPFYSAAPSSMKDVDVSCLEGKRIVIDPGHGGVFRGALGTAGLAEADVNLGVALYLWGLLRDAGADVLLTRSSDIDFVGGVAEELRRDLSRRSETAASFNPHLFVSLHHNADLSRTNDRNQVETYFKMLDDGPSKDVATLVHRRLQETLQIPEGSVVAGNYFVLRNSPCPAVLGEPSYITNPWVEDKLRLAEKQLLEAQAYFLGIVEYFSRGVPAIASLAPRDTVVTETRPVLTASLAEEWTAEYPPVATCELDGERLDAGLGPSGWQLVARPERPLEGGRHEFCFSFRNSAGNSSARVCAGFETDPAPVEVSLEAIPAAVPTEGGVLVTAAVSDENSNPVRDGTPVVFSGSAGAFASETVLTAAGIASTFFFDGGRQETLTLRAASGGLTDSVSLAPSAQVTTCLSVSDALSGAVLAGARVSDGDSVTSVTTPQGLAAVAGRPGGLIVSSAGYVPALIPEEAGAGVSSGKVVAVRMKPVALGVLHGARVTLDLGVAASALSERVAEELEALLKGAGAGLLMLGSEMPDEDKVAASERFGAQRYLRVESVAKGRGVVLHYPDSGSGAKLAARLTSWWGKVVLEAAPGVSEDAHYVLRQTSSPAVVARMAAVPGARERAVGLEAAYAFYLALLEDLGLNASLLIESSVRASGEIAGEVADMVLDGFIRVPLSADGSARFFCEEGVHMVSVASESRRTAPHFVTVRAAQKVGGTAR